VTTSSSPVHARSGDAVRAERPLARFDAELAEAALAGREGERRSGDAA
jgi:hypothetical protein